MRAEYVLAFGLALLLGTPGAAHAEDAASAGALFEQGVADMTAGNFGAACPAIQESQRLEPRPGTLFTLAECEAKWGRVASAVAHYEEYVGMVSRLAAEQQARHVDRVVLARQAAARLKPSVPTLTLVLPTSAPPGTVVLRDGIELQGAALGAALPVDPGEHVVLTRAPGGSEREARIALAPNENKRLVLDVNASAPVESVPVAPLAAQAQPKDAPHEQASPLRTWGWASLGVGAAGVIVGSITGVLVFQKKKVVDDECQGPLCSPTGLAAANAGKTLGTVSNVGFAVGLVGLATGAVLLLTAPHHPQKAAGGTRWQPLLAGDPTGGYVALSRRW